MKIKTLLALVAASVLSLSFLAGCKTTPDGSSGITPQQIQDSGVVLKNLARSTSLLAIEKDQDNRKYVGLAVDALDTFLVGTNYSPGLLSTRLEVVFKEVRDVKIQIAMNSALDLYEIYYGRYVRDQVSGNETARILLTSLRDGAHEAMRLRLPVPKPLP
jgi:hypothetical protein